MKQYPKAQGLMAAWIRAQHERTDLVGEFAKAAVVPENKAPVWGFRITVWRHWALAHGLTEAHVEAILSEYARTPLAAKHEAYDKYGSRAARAV